MQTKYEQITELQDKAAIISQLEASIYRNKVAIENFTKHNSHGENGRQIKIEEGFLEEKTQLLIKLKQQFDNQLSQIKPYYNN